MKVLLHTTEQLIIQEQLIGIWMLSLGSISAGLFMFFLFEPPVDWVGAFCLSLGGIFATLTPTETLTFDKVGGGLTIKKGRYLGHQITYLPTSEIKTVTVEPLEVINFRFYQVNLQLISGQKLTVTRTFSTDIQQQQRIVRHIRDFLVKSRQPQGGSLPSSTLSGP
jgi:hypothetical protein